MFARVLPGTRTELEMTPVIDSIWLVNRFAVNLQIAIFWRKFVKESELTFRDYRPAATALTKAPEKPVRRCGSLLNGSLEMSQGMMALRTRLALLLCLSPALSLAGSWSGVLVNSKCYGAEERNVNPTDTLTNVDRDRNLEIRYCSPNAKTKSFAVVQEDGSRLRFDSAGNAKAAELVSKAISKTGKKSLLMVVVTGELQGKTIRLDSISTAR
ncbi:MAG: hypothetical protein WBE37_11615 [Bryobacteraceae bacterium]